METYLIVTVSDDGFIRDGNKIPFEKQPRDMEYFNQRTLYADKTKTPVVVMDSKKFDTLKKPLTSRYNIVVTSSEHIVKLPDVIYANSLEQALSEARKLTSHAYIIGGAEIYKQALESDVVDAIFITRVLATVEGDTFFPPIDETRFENKLYHDHASDADKAYAMRFETWVRI